MFDLDGVIIDSEPIHFKADKELLKRKGIKYSLEDASLFTGKREKECYIELKRMYCLKESVKELIEERRKLFFSLLNKENIKPMPGLINLLNILKKNNKKIAIASSSEKEYIEYVLNKFNIKEFFEVIVSGYEVEKGKPEPDVFLKASEKLKVNPNECLVIEDSRNGVIAAKKAGMKCIAIPNSITKNQDFSLADRVLNSLNEITIELINSL
ncbi:MAG: HAD family phosphatase [Nitrososphaerota archaeon]